MRTNTQLKSARLVVVLIAGLELSGCGTDPGDRTLSGGLLGAGTGAAIGAIAGNAGEGALIGGLGGAAIGALTNSDSLNLGTPPWRHRAARAASYRHPRYARSDCATHETQTQRITTCPKTR